MLRNSVAFILALYAIGFAFAALAAVRWPTLLMLVAFFGESANELSTHVSWRELGLVYGLIYLVAAFFFYTTSSLIAQHKGGSVFTYLIAVAIGYPPFVLFDFDAGWWQNPDAFEQTVLLSGFISVFLLGAILELNQTRNRKTKTAHADQTVAADGAAPIVLTTPIAAPIVAPIQPEAAPARRHRAPVSAAILRQRQSFAYHGRKAKARRHR